MPTRPFGKTSTLSGCRKCLQRCVHRFRWSHEHTLSTNKSCQVTIQTLSKCHILGHMEVSEIIVGVYVFIICLVNYRIKKNHERPSGRERLPGPCMLLSGHFGNGVVDNFNWATNNISHSNGNSAFRSIICEAASDFTSASLCNEAVAMIQVGEKPDNFAS